MSGPADIEDRVSASPSVLSRVREPSDAPAQDFAQIATEKVRRDNGTDQAAAPAPAAAALPAPADDPVEDASASADALVSVTLRLTVAAEQALQDLAIRRGVSTTQVLGEAIVEKKFFSDHRRDGTEVVLRFPDGRLSTVSWVAAPWPLGDQVRGGSPASALLD